MCVALVFAALSRAVERADRTVNLRRDYCGFSCTVLMPVPDVAAEAGAAAAQALSLSRDAEQVKSCLRPAARSDLSFVALVSVASSFSVTACSPFGRILRERACSSPSQPSRAFECDGQKCCG